MDITERKRSEESFREMQKLESLGLLAGGIAHDFNNLLTGIIGNASMLETEFSATSPQGELTRCLMDAAERMARLTSQMLAYSGRGRFVVEPVNLSRHVIQIVSLIQASIPKTVELRLSLDNNLPIIEADASQLQQVIMNLVINAAESIASSQGVVEVGTSAREVREQELLANVTRQTPSGGQYVVLTVRDNGVGMDSATQARIFDPFFTTKFTGRGLGLAAVLGIVRGHGGLLTVDSTMGAGTTFRVFFPVAQGLPGETANPTVAFEQGSGTVLVVDDEELVRTTAKAALSRAGYRVLLASNGQEAVDLFAARSSEIDLVVLDMTMPVMGGEEALQHLAKARPDVVVLASSGYNEEEAQHRFGSRIKGFLQKPYTAGQLTGKVGQLLRRR
jgi:nitrogen-specific signal transduction histidine kinase/CheY-like chemotaxis protein